MDFSICDVTVVFQNIVTHVYIYTYMNLKYTVTVAMSIHGNQTLSMYSDILESFQGIVFTLKLVKP